MKKVISITLMCSLLLTFITAPVMALPLKQLSSMSGFLEVTEPWLSPEAQSYVDEINMVLESRDASGMEEFLEYAGNVFLLISIVMILGGIQEIITGSDIGEGLISLILGVMFLIYSIMMLDGAGETPIE